MTRNSWKWLKEMESYGYSRKWLEMTGNSWNGLEVARISWKKLYLAENVFFKKAKTAWNCVKVI